MTYYDDTVYGPVPTDDKTWDNLKNTADINLSVKRLSPTAKIPKYQTDGAACFDLHASEDLTVQPGRMAPVDTGLAFEIPHGWEMQIRSRSGKAFKNSVTAFPGTIDSDYRGEVKVLIINGGTEAFSIKAGDRIAQAKVSRAYRANIIEAEELSTTYRGNGGFGSTGK